MSNIILLENGFVMNESMRFTYPDGIISSSAAEIISETNGIVPDFIQNAINEIYAVLNMINILNIEDISDDFNSILELYDSFCTWFWSTTNLRKHLNKEEAQSICATFTFIIPHIKNENSYMENIIKSSIMDNNNICSIENSEDLEEHIIHLTNEIKALRKDVNNIDEKIDVIDEKIDYLKQEIKELSNIIAVEQSLLSRQLNDIENEPDKEKLISVFADEIIDRISNGITQKYEKKEYDSEMLQLEDLFGSSWSKLSDDSKKFIVSSKIIYKKQRELGNFLDYSGVCVLVTKALELEMDIRFYGFFMNYMKRNYPGKHNYHLFPTTLLNKFGKPCRQKDYTLGSVPYTLCYLIDENLSEEQITNNKQKLVEFCKSELMKDKAEEEILSILYDYGEKIEMIKNDYRNPCAHTNSLQAINAKECLDLVIDVQKLLKKMLDSFDK